MSDPDLILKIMDTVTIPVMAKCRIGHFVEAQILEAIDQFIVPPALGAQAGVLGAIALGQMI